VGHPILKPTPELTTLLLAKGARVPRIIDYDTVNGKRYILMEKAQGGNLAYDWMSLSDRTKEGLIAQLAEQLQIWHGITFDRYAIPIVAYQPFENLKPAIKRLALKEINELKRDKLPKELLPAIDVVESFYYANVETLNETGTAVLCHQDIHLENIFYQADELTCIIDLDWASQAPKDYELWKILDTFHRPKHTVEEKLEQVYGDYQMIKELNWLKKYYPQLFEGENLATRVRLYYVDPLLENIIDYQNGHWGQRALDKVTEKVRDFYLNSWLDEALRI
jgi:aminoglycoside phosphotransferase